MTEQEKKDRSSWQKPKLMTEHKKVKANERAEGRLGESSKLMIAGERQKLIIEQKEVRSPQQSRKKTETHDRARER